MTWTPNPPAPKGWQASIVTSRDSLASLETELGLAAHEIAKANGVPWPGRKTCVWSRDITAWVLDEKDLVPGQGGFKRPFNAAQRNTCEADGRHVSFSDGQIINLPIGARPPARSAPPTKTRATSKAGLAVLATLIVGGLAAASGSKGKAA